MQRSRSGRQRLQRRIVVLVLSLIICSLAVWAGAPVTFSPSTRVMLFSPDAGQWAIAAFEQTEPGNEFFFNSQLYRVSEAGKAQVVPNIDADKLLEADLHYDKSSRRPAASDVVQVLDKDTRFVLHGVLATVQPGATVRFQGRAWRVRADRSVVNTGTVFSSARVNLQRIQITARGMQHVTDRHTAGGNTTAHKSIFNPTEDVQALVKCAQLTTPVQEPNGLFKRLFDAGRVIGVDGYKGKQTSTYTVITKPSGELVTAYPVLE
jgi:hypothetical protein